MSIHCVVSCNRWALYGLFADPTTITSHLDSIADLVPAGALEQDGTHRRREIPERRRQAEAVLMPVGTADALVGIEIDVAISADHTAQVADLVVRRSHRRNGKRGSEAHQLIAGCQMGTPFAPCAGAGYILPSSIREDQ